MAAEDLPREDHNQEDITQEHSLDTLARGLANGSVSRRKALRLMGAALLGGILASIPESPWPPKGAVVIQLMVPAPRERPTAGAIAST